MTIQILEKYFKAQDKNKRLVISLMELILHDRSISEDYVFYISDEGEQVTKSMLADADEIEFEPFILGIWQYVAAHIDTKAAAEKATFDRVFKVEYDYNGHQRIAYRSGDIIQEQSELFVDLIYTEFE